MDHVRIKLHFTHLIHFFVEFVSFCFLQENSTTQHECDYSIDNNPGGHGDTANLLLFGKIGDRKLCKNDRLCLQYEMVRAIRRPAEICHFDAGEYSEATLLPWHESHPIEFGNIHQSKKPS